MKLVVVFNGKELIAAPDSFSSEADNSVLLSSSSSENNSQSIAIIITMAVFIGFILILVLVAIILKYKLRASINSGKYV